MKNYYYDENSPLVFVGRHDIIPGYPVITGSYATGTNFDPFRYPIVAQPNQEISVISSYSLWRCVYCSRINPSNAFECLGCGSGRME